MSVAIETFRHFNRFYTRYVGALQKRFLESPFSLAESRVLFELAHGPGRTATDIGKELDLDNGYLSRMLQTFVHRGLVSKQAAVNDGRQHLLSLTPKGHATFDPIEQRQHDEVAVTLASLTDEEQERLTSSMRAIEEILSGERTGESLYVLRSDRRPGDLGWVVERHGVLYGREYDWNEEMEALVAEIVAAFVRSFDPKRERMWIAERDGTRAGCIFLVKKSETVAQLRLLLVEPSARGFGIGRRLVRECIGFARAAGYRKVILWTNDVLHAARHLYEDAGFVLAKEERHHSFGQDLVGQYWELTLRR
jgi:DNA-binding MarR family transcriptional regulator/N-acetylglutamate synthase-like GNAT family acetyltransferase